MTQVKKIQIWLPLLLSIAMIAGMFIGYKLFLEMNQSANTHPADAGTSDIMKSFRPGSVQQVLNLIELRYVDSLAKDSLEGSAIEAIVARLDPHSQYIQASQLDEIDAELKGNFSGVGIEYMIINDTVIAVAVLEKGPADAGGVLEGDALLTVNGQSIAGTSISHEQLRNLLRGENNSKVLLQILRKGKTIDVPLKRGTIPLPSLDSWYMINSTTGYLKINRFSETTFFEFMDATYGLKEAGMKSMILDLRGNGGGLLDQATKIADELLQDGTTIVKVKGNKVAEEITYSTKPGVFEEGRLIVLVDENSASASEVLAAALQENDRATIIGRRTFGKGLVQEQYNLGNKGALRLTVARYLTPLGRSIQKPYNGNKADYHHEVAARNPWMGNPDDTTGKKAYLTRKGRRIYELGGVLPDSTILPDTSLIARLLVRFAGTNKFAELSYHNYHRSKEKMAAFGSAEAYFSQFKLGKEEWVALEQVLRADSNLGKIKLKDSDKLLLEQRMKANMARYKWRNKGYYIVLNQQDKMVQTALQMLALNQTPTLP